MTSIAARLDPCVNWMRLLSRTHGRILWVFPAAVIAIYLVAVNWGDALSRLSEARSLRHGNAAILAEARRLGIDYAAVSADPVATLGKPVAWCVSSKDGEHGFVEEKASMPVVWLNPAEELQTLYGTHGYCWNELAIVAGMDRGAVLLRAIERL